MADRRRVAEVSLNAEATEELRTWLELQFGFCGDVVVKDPRLSWFLPLWRRVAAGLGVEAKIVTMLRHPAAVVDSKQRWYGEWQGQVARTAGWVNQALYLERATRDSPRALVRYEDLLEDWMQVVGRVGDALDLATVRDAPVAAIRSVHEFVDSKLRRSQPEWGDAPLPPRLIVQAEEVWGLPARLAEADAAEAASIGDRMDAIRADYVSLYDEAEAIAQSSIFAAGKPAPRRHSQALRPARRVPRRFRHAVPLRGRIAIARALRRIGTNPPRRAAA